MSDFQPVNPERQDSATGNHAQPTSMDVAAVLESIRLKSLKVNQNPFGLEVIEAADASQTPSEIAAEDWDSLFEAVETRLRNTVGETMSPSLPAEAQASVSRMKAVVLECIGALDMLHRALMQQRKTTRASATNELSSDAAPALPLTNSHDGTRKNIAS